MGESCLASGTTAVYQKRIEEAKTMLLFYHLTEQQTSWDCSRH
jgi:hypothetical protein